MLSEAYKLYKDGFEWVIRKEEDLELMKQANDEFYEVDEMEDIFFSKYKLIEDPYFNHKVILNKGEILKIFSNTNVKFSKYDLRKIYTKNDMLYNNFIHLGEKKKGFVLFEKMETTEFLEQSIF